MNEGIYRNKIDALQHANDLLERDLKESLRIQDDLRIKNAIFRKKERERESEAAASLIGLSSDRFKEIEARGAKRVAEVTAKDPTIDTVLSFADELMKELERTMRILWATYAGLVVALLLLFFRAFS